MFCKFNTWDARGCVAHTCGGAFPQSLLFVLFPFFLVFIRGFLGWWTSCKSAIMEGVPKPLKWPWGMLEKFGGL